MGSLVLLPLGGGDLGVLLLEVRLKTVRATKSPNNSLLPAGIADLETSDSSLRTAATWGGSRHEPEDDLGHQKRDEFGDPAVL